MVEYVLLVTAVLLVCIYFFTTGPMAPSVNASLGSMVNQIDNINSQIQLPPS
jgi:hypothetical protein